MVRKLLAVLVLVGLCSAEVTVEYVETHRETLKFRWSDPELRPHDTYLVLGDSAWRCDKSERVVSVTEVPDSSYVYLYNEIFPRKSAHSDSLQIVYLDTILPPSSGDTDVPLVLDGDWDHLYNRSPHVTWLGSCIPRDNRLFLYSPSGNYGRLLISFVSDTGQHSIEFMGYPSESTYLRIDSGDSVPIRFTLPHIVSLDRGQHTIQLWTESGSITLESVLITSDEVPDPPLPPNTLILVKE